MLHQKFEVRVHMCCYFRGDQFLSASSEDDRNAVQVRTSLFHPFRDCARESCSRSKPNTCGNGPAAELLRRSRNRAASSTTGCATHVPFVTPIRPTARGR